MKKSVIACLILAVSVCVAGCGSQNTNEATSVESSSIEDSSVEDTSVENTSVDDTSVGKNEDDDSGSTQTNPGVEDNDNINHGYSITVRTEPDPKELLRSKEVLYDEEEARDFLINNINYPEGEPYTFEMTDSSIDDPGAYMWYDFTVFYDGIPIERSEFTVITFNDGTIIEGDEGLFSVVPEDRSNINTPEEILADYAKQNNDDRDYKYQTEHYFYSIGHAECPYVYVYRYDCGNVLENTTLTLNAKTGELLGCYPDAID